MRNIFYAQGTFEEHKFVYTGLEFYEFMRAVKKPIENILLLEGQFVSEHYVHCFEVLKGEKEIEELLTEQVSEYGDFCFADCKAGTAELLSHQEIAELLYLSHMFQPMKSPFFETLQNNYFYLAHDDGYYGQLYCKNPLDFSEFITSKIEWYIRNMGVVVEEIDQKNKEILLGFTRGGLLIDLNSFRYCNNKILIPLYLLKRQLDSMDDLYNFYDDIVDGSPWKGWLQYEKGKWSIQGTSDHDIILN